MVGTLGFYDADGERLHTVYTAATPEHGKLTFYERLDGEVARAKSAFPGARFVGLADGAKDNWLYLETVTKELVANFYHASEYVWMAADALFNASKTPAEIRPWVESWLHRLKHEKGADRLLIADLERRVESLGRPRLPEGVERALTYFKNQSKAGRMGYAAMTAKKVPIGSGVTEAACKVLVKQRLCGSGIRWKGSGAAAVLSVRCLTYTPGRWEQFWARIGREGFILAA